MIKVQNNVFFLFFFRCDNDCLDVQKLHHRTKVTTTQTENGAYIPPSWPIFRFFRGRT